VARPIRSKEDVQNHDALTKELREVDEQIHKHDEQSRHLRERAEALRKLIQIKLRERDASMRVTREAERSTRELLDIKKRIDERLHGSKIVANERKIVRSLVDKENEPVEPAENKAREATRLVEEARREVGKARDALADARARLGRVAADSAGNREATSRAAQRFGLAEARLREGSELQGFYHLVEAARLLQHARPSHPEKIAHDHAVTTQEIQAAEEEIRRATQALSERESAAESAVRELAALRSACDNRVLAELQRIERRPAPRVPEPRRPEA
jgi:hypothetical protein